MFARSLRIAAAVGLLMVLASCTLLHGRSIDRPLVYYVRNVTVMADARIPLDLIEVQTGSYLGEDDIVRFEDTYGRI